MSTAKPPLKDQCQLCGSVQDLRFCSDCDTVLYCSPEHEKEDMVNHKVACGEIRKYIVALRIEEHVLRDHAADHGLPANPIDNPSPWFSQFPGSRFYLDVRKNFLTTLTRINTRPSIEAALVHAEQMIAFDFLGYTTAKSALPSLYLRMDEEQKCYDFCKWSLNIRVATKKRGFCYLDIQTLFEPDADVFEDLTDFEGHECGGILYLVAILLIKIRLHENLSVLQATTATVGRKVPREILDHINTFLARRVVAEKREVFESIDRRATIQNLEQQIKSLVVFLCEKYKSGWMSPISGVWKNPLGLDDTVEGTPRDCATICFNNSAAWDETPGAIDMVKKLLEDTEFKVTTQRRRTMMTGGLHST